MHYISYALPPLGPLNPQPWLLQPSCTVYEEAQDLNFAEGPCVQERFCREVPTRLCSRIEEPLASSAQIINRPEALRKIVDDHQTKQPSKRLLERLLCELSLFPDTENTIVHKSFKNPPPKKKRKKIQSASKYIGVSKNGNKWQALLLVGTQRLYLGSVEDELDAAILYDRHSLANLGIKKVNVNRHLTFRLGLTFLTQRTISLNSMRKNSKN